MLPHEQIELLRQRVLRNDPTVTDEELRAALEAVAALRPQATINTQKAARVAAPKIDVMALLRKAAEKRHNPPT